MPVRTGSIVGGHPYIEIVISPDGKQRVKQTALVDTGFSGFVSLPGASARIMGLKAHATTFYTLANGKRSEPVPLAYGFACVEGDLPIQGLFSISDHTSTVIGMDFLTRCGKVFVVAPAGIVIMSADEFRAALKHVGSLGDGV